MSASARARASAYQRRRIDRLRSTHVPIAASMMFPPCLPIASPSASGMDARQGEDPLAGLRLCRQPGSARRTTNFASRSRWDEQLSFHCRIRGGIRPMVTAGFEVPIRVARTDQPSSICGSSSRTRSLAYCIVFRQGTTRRSTRNVRAKARRSFSIFPSGSVLARSFLAIRCAAKVPCGDLSIFASANRPATLPRPGHAG
jgi:hypothetical protein